MWKHKNTFAIGGLENVGFDNEDRLVVLSSQGVGIFDCISGTKIYRDSRSWWEDFNEVAGTIPDYGILAGSQIRTCGLYGEDFLSKRTSDGWMLEKAGGIPDDPPFERYLVNKIYLTHRESAQRVCIAKDGACELRAFGFSGTGNSLVVALSCDLVIWSRG